MPIAPKKLPGQASRPSLFSDLGISLLTQLAVVGTSVYCLRLAAHVMDPASVGEFALLRRIQVFLSPILLLGIFVGLPRSLGRLTHDVSRSASTVAAAWSIGLTSMLAALALLVLFPGQAARLLFGNGGSAGMILPLALLLIANQLFQLVFAEWRGRLQIRRANAYMFVQQALLPTTVIVILAPRGVDAMLLGLGGASAAMAAVVACVALRDVPRLARRTDVRACVKELSAYSLPRVPGDLALSGLFALGPILAAHSLDLLAAGSLAIGMNLVTALSAGFTPIGLVLLPRLSLALSRDGESKLQGRLSLLLGMACYGATFLLIAGSAVANPWLRCVLGEKYVFDSTTMLLLVAAAAANVVFVVFRSVLDAAYFRPMNAIHASIAVLVLLSTWICSRWLYIGHPLVSVCAAIAIGFGTLGGLTLVAVARRFGIRLHSGALGRWLAVHGILLGITLAAGRLVGTTLSLVGVSTGLLLVWLGAMRLLSVAWPMELRAYVVGLRRAEAGPSREGGAVIANPAETADAAQQASGVDLEQAIGFTVSVASKEPSNSLEG